jgi:hypothetical protein
MFLQMSMQNQLKKLKSQRNNNSKFKMNKVLSRTLGLSLLVEKSAEKTA